MNLIEWQKFNNLSARDVAKVINVDQSWISHFKVGRRRPSPALALRIERATGGAVSRDEMLFPELYIKDTESNNLTI
jgi:DNA-binding transcriptional regulator YdaS (Cro superfamily)